MSIRPAGRIGYGVVAALTVVQAADDASAHRTWACACGFLLDDHWTVTDDHDDESLEDQLIVDDQADVEDQADKAWMTDIRVAVSMVESAHWELDRADLALAEAIEAGIARGYAAAQVADAAGIAEDDVTTLLHTARSGRSDL